MKLLIMQFSPTSITSSLYPAVLSY
jgi:hypothetical protein